MSKGKKNKGEAKAKVEATAVKEPQEKKEATSTTKYLYVETRFRQFLRDREIHLGADIWDKADEVFRGILEAACERAKANGRKTLRAIDF